MPSLEHIFLSMDGVLADFAGAARTLLGQRSSVASRPERADGIHSVLGISESEFSRLVEGQGADFWTRLPELEWSKTLVDLVRRFAPMTVLDSTSWSPGCYEGKAQWLGDKLPMVAGKRFSDFLFGRPIELLAGPRRVLIDDSEARAEAFRAAGGESILFPQPWNVNHAIKDRLGYVKAQLELLDEVATLYDFDHHDWSPQVLSQLSQAMVGEPFQLAELLSVGAENVALRLVDGNVVKLTRYLELPKPNPFSLPVVDWGYVPVDGSETLWYIQPFATTPIDERDFMPFLATLRSASLRMTDPSKHNLGYFAGEVKILDPWSVQPLSAEET
ncbi:MAG: hypothetical protein U0795_26320 [Pirellulales bacterium]